MYNKVTIFTFVCLIFISSNTSAEDRAGEAIKFSLGLNAGSVVGNGIIYRAYFSPHFVQGTFAGYIDKDEEEEYVDFSIAYGRYLKIIQQNYFGVPIGIKWLVSGEIVYDQLYEQSDNRLNFGSGIGLDFGSVGVEGFLISFDVFYAVSYKGIEKRKFNSLNIASSVGILYSF